MWWFRRAVHAFVAVWVAAWCVKLVGWILPMSVQLQAILQLGAVLIAGTTSWRGSRDLDPWTAKELRDGALYYGIVLLILPLAGVTVAALAGETWIAAAAGAVALLIAASAAYVYRHAVTLGAPEQDDRDTPPASTREVPA